MRRLYMVLFLGMAQATAALSAAHSDDAKSLTFCFSAWSGPAPTEHMERADNPTPPERSHLAVPEPGFLDSIPAVEECEDDFGEDQNSRVLLEHVVPFPARHGRAPEDFFGPRQNLLVRSLPIRGPPGALRG